MRILLVSTFVIAASLALPGCVAVPIAAPEEKPFKDLVENFFTPGTTTATAVVDKLGEPDIREDSRWIYRDSRAGWQWGFCAGAYYTAGCGALPRSSTDYFLVVELVDNEVVADARLFSETELCAELRLCFENTVQMRAAAAEKDAAAKLFRPAPVGCAVYTYSTTDSDSTAGELSIDTLTVGGLVGTSGYYLHTVAPGPHAWIVAPLQDKNLPYPIVRSKFDCENGQVAFLRYSNGMWFNKVRLVDAERGKKDILTRWLAESTTSPDEIISSESASSNWLRDGQIYVIRDDGAVSAYQLGESDIVPRWGRSDAGEPCGMRAALEDYKLSPAGGTTGLLFAESLHSPVQLRAVCSANGDCSFASAIDQETCEATPGTTIVFDPRSKLLLLEAGGDSYRELFFGKAKSLQKLAACHNYACEIDVSRLHQAAVE